MTAALVVVAVIAVGFPLVAWWLGGRRFWAALSGPARRDLHADMVGKHRLGPADIAAVQQAMAWGRAVEDPGCAQSSWTGRGRR